MHLQAVKAASGPELAAAAAAAAENAADLVDEAELLASARSAGRACALAALAVEEVGKSQALAALAGVGGTLRAQAPLRRMLEWHGLKQAAGGLVALVQASPSMVAVTLTDLPERELDEVLSSLARPADEADQLKRSGLYVDIEAGGLSEPSYRRTTRVAS